MFKRAITHIILSTITTFVLLRTIYIVDGASSTLDVPGMCKGSVWYTKRQRRLCVRHFPNMKWVKAGVEKGLEECRRIMKDERWNCSPLTWTGVFQRYGILKKISRQTAFVQAITAAGVMHQIAQGCTNGAVSSCPCGPVLVSTKRNGVNDFDPGCSHNFKTGATFSRNFMDPKPILRHSDKVRAHNHEVGRRVVRENQDTQCKCHGTSSTCSRKTCWKNVPKMSLVADVLWKRYKKAVKSQWDPQSKTITTRIRRGNKKVIRTSQITYINNSPDFCDLNKDMGIMGTKGRVCDPKSSGSNKCKDLCCGRKTKRDVKVVSVKCHCKFVWCCAVKCQTCKQNEITYTCV